MTASPPTDAQRGVSRRRVWRGREVRNYAVFATPSAVSALGYWAARLCGGARDGPGAGTSEMRDPFGDFPPAPFSRTRSTHGSTADEKWECLTGGNLIR